MPLLRRTGDAAVVLASLDLDLHGSGDGEAFASPLDPRRVDPRLREEFRAAVEEARDIARSEGFRAGHREGLTQGRAEAELAARQHREDAETQLREQHAALETALEVLTVAARERDEQAEPTYAELRQVAVLGALQLARQLLGREVAAGPQATIDILSTAAARTAGTEPLRVRVAPQEAEAVRQALLQHVRRPEVIADPRLSPGGGLLEDGATRIDLRLTSTLAAVEDLLAATVDATPHPTAMIPQQRPAANSEHRSPAEVRP